MRLSTIFELLLIFLLIAFAAYGRVIDRDEVVPLRRIARATKQTNLGVSFMSLKQATENVNKYCTCNDNICNCCRNFHIPLVRLQGPGCASLQYLKENNLAVQLSFGDNILASQVVSGKKPRAICVPMPGGLSKFCGRIYSIEREADNHFKACLGLELQSASDLEASLRVSCFRFGPEGLQLRPAEALPVLDSPKPEKDDDDDDYDIFDLDDDDDDEENDEASPAKDPQTSQPDEDDDDDDDDDDDVLGFGALIDIITGDDDDSKKKATTAAPILPFTIPMIKPSTVPPKPAKPAKPAADKIPLENKKPTTMPELPEILAVKPNVTVAAEENPTKNDEKIEVTSEKIEVADEKVETTVATGVEEETATVADNLMESEEISMADEAVTEKILESDESATDVAVADVKVTETTVAEAQTEATTAATAINTKKIIGIKTVKKPSTSPNAISNDTKKPLQKPAKPDRLDESEEDEEDYILASDSDEDEEETVLAENESAEDDEEEEEGEDDSEEEEDTVLSALVADDDKEEETKDDKLGDNEASKPEEDDADYGMGLAELLARKRNSRKQWSGRQSKVMRF